MKPDSVLTVVAVVMCSFEGDGVEGSIPNPASILALSCLLSTCITDRWRSRKLAITSLVQTGHLCWDGRGQPTHSVSQADFFSFLNGKSIKCIKMAYQILVRPKVHIYHVQYMSFSFEDVILLF